MREVGAAARGSALRSIFFGEHRLRTGWRLLIFLLLFAVFLFVGQLALAALPADAIFWVGPATLLVAALAAGWILIARLDGRPPSALGFAVMPAVPAETSFGFAIGAGLLLAVVLLLVATGAVGWSTEPVRFGDYLAMMCGSIIFFAVAAAWEEAFFRGYPFQVLVEGIGAWPAILLSGAIFALAHGQNPETTPLALANIFLASVLLSICYLRTRSLWFPTALHIGWNWSMAFLLDLPVSGLTAFDTPGYTGIAREPWWWSGGAFGPEAGLAATIVLVIGIVWLLRTPRLGESARMRTLGPIVDRRIPTQWP